MFLRISIAFTIFAVCLLQAVLADEESKLLRAYPAEEAVQGVAADSQYFYAIANSRIGKYERGTGERVATWVATEEIPLKHLNAGLIHQGMLYCAHSNFPQRPEASSVEIFDTQTLKHVGSHSFGIYEGSLTWVDFYDGHWWAVFAHYSTNSLDPQAKPNTYTSLVKFDLQWRRVAGWCFPEEVLERFAPNSCSGGFWNREGKIFCTGHDHGEIYVLRLPLAGSILLVEEVISVPMTGQGIAKDPDNDRVVWGIDRPQRKVLQVNLK